MIMLLSVGCKMLTTVETHGESIQICDQDDGIQWETEKVHWIRRWVSSQQPVAVQQHQIQRLAVLQDLLHSGALHFEFKIIQHN